MIRISFALAVSMLSVSQLAGQSKIHEAAETGDIAGIKAALEEGEEIEKPDTSGFTPLMKASMAGKTEAVQFLLEHKANMYAKNVFFVDSFYFACAHNRLETVRLLWKNIPPARRAEVLEQTDGMNGATPLWRAVSNGSLDVARFLLTLKPDVNHADVVGYSVLLEAAGRNRREIIPELLKAGANPYAVTGEGETLGEVLLQAKHSELYKVIFPGKELDTDTLQKLMQVRRFMRNTDVGSVNEVLASIKDPVERKSFANRAFMIAAHVGAILPARELAKNESIDWNYTDENGWSFLHAASSDLISRGGAANVIELCLEHGTNPDLRSKKPNGRYATGATAISILEALKARYGDPNKKDFRDESIQLIQKSKTSPPKK